MRKLGILLFAVFLANSLFSVNFLVSPPRFELISSNNEITKTIVVSNPGKETIHLKAYTMDWELNRDGSQAFFEPGIMPYSCSKWIKINPLEFDVAPGEEKQVRMTVITPNEIRHTYWSVIFFESAPKPIEAPTMLQINARVGTIVYVYDPKYAVNNIDIVNMEDLSDNVKLSLYNKGNVHTRVKYNYIVKDSLNNIVFTSKEKNVLVLPGYYRDVILELPKLKGIYSVLVSCDYGDRVIKEGEIKIYR